MIKRTLAAMAFVAFASPALAGSGDEYLPAMQFGIDFAKKHRPALEAEYCSALRKAKTQEEGYAAGAALGERLMREALREMIDQPWLADEEKTAVAVGSVVGSVMMIIEIVECDEGWF